MDVLPVGGKSLIHVHECCVCFVGALTKNILAMKERLEGDLKKEEQSGLPVITEAQRRKEREMVTKEVCVW